MAQYDFAWATAGNKTNSQPPTIHTSMNTAVAQAIKKGYAPYDKREKMISNNRDVLNNLAAELVVNVSRKVY